MADEKPNGAAPTPAGSGVKERSPNYPQYPLTEAIGLAQKIYDKEKRTAVAPVDIAKALGYSSLSGLARSAIATLRQYGLIENADGNVRLSETAMAILHQPADSHERAVALAKAARKPQLIEELAASHSEASDDALKGFLITKKAFTPEAAGRFIIAFRDALKFAKAESSGYNPPDGAWATVDTSLTGPGGAKAPTAPKSGAHMEFTWPLSGDAVATITVSRNIEVDDIETLASYFEIAKKALLKAAKTHAVTEPSPNRQG